MCIRFEVKWLALWRRWFIAYCGVALVVPRSRNYRREFQCRVRQVIGAVGSVDRGDATITATTERIGRKCAERSPPSCLSIFRYFSPSYPLFAHRVVFLCFNHTLFKGLLLVCHSRFLLLFASVCADLPHFSLQSVIHQSFLPFVSLFLLDIWAMKLKARFFWFI